MPARNKRSTNERKVSRESPAPKRGRAAKTKRLPGEGLDRSTEAVIEAGRRRMKSAPPTALPDRRTTESRRGR